MTRSTVARTRRMVALGAVGALVSALSVVGATPAAADIPDPVPPPAANPDLPASCGLDVALVLDGTGSIGEAGAVDAVEAAATAFLESFVDTSTNVGIVEFNQGIKQSVPLTPVTLESIAEDGVLGEAIEEYDSGGFTNWQGALGEATSILTGPGSRPDKPDLVLFVTDGEPNTLNGENPGEPGFPDAVYPAVTDANGLKALPAHILAVGVGQAFDNEGNNPERAPDRREALTFVSGTDAYDPTGTYGSTTFSASTTDVVYTTNFADLEAALTQIATELCDGTLTITKEASTPTDRDTYAPAFGWDFTATPSSPADAYTWVLPDTAAAPSKTATTNEGGQVVFEWDVASTGWTPAIGVVETLQDGYEMLEPVCSEGGVPRAVTGFDATTGAFSVDVGPTDAVQCVVRNRADAPPPPPPPPPVKTHDPTGTVAIGDTITYTVTATAEVAYTSFTISDEMPGFDPDFPDSTAVDYVEGSATCTPPTCTITFDEATQTLSAAFGAVTPGEYSVTFQAVVTSNGVIIGTTDGGVVTNRGSLTYTVPGLPPPPPIPTNEVENPVRLVTAVGDSSASCIADTPYFNFRSDGWFAGESVTLHILNRDLVEIETRALTADANGVVTGPLLWPGYSVDPVTNVKVYPPASNRPISIFLEGSPVTPTVLIAYPPASDRCDAGLTLVKSNSPTGTVPFGSTITYTLTVGVPAGGAFNQDGVVLSDYIPGYDPANPTSGKTTYIDGSARCVDAGVPGISTCDITFDPATRQLVWKLGTMRPGDTRRVSFQVTVDSAPTAVTLVNAAAVVSDYWPGTPSNPVTNQAVPPGGRPGLPKTGGDALALGWAGLLLLTAGAGLRLAARRT